MLISEPLIYLSIVNATIKICDRIFAVNYEKMLE